MFRRPRPVPISDLHAALCALGHVISLAGILSTPSGPTDPAREPLRLASTDRNRESSGPGGRTSRRSSAA